MLHAFPIDRADCFHLTAEIDDDSVTLVVEDTGVGLPLSRVERGPDIDLTATSGRGLHIIRELMTDVAVETGPSRRGTRLEMRKSLL
jgi:anti-sigma regulatory factor (Ser/Thr protein kinase)